MRRPGNVAAATDAVTLAIGRAATPAAACSAIAPVVMHGTSPRRAAYNRAGDAAPRRPFADDIERKRRTGQRREAKRGRSRCVDTQA